MMNSPRTLSVSPRVSAYSVDLRLAPGPRLPSRVHPYPLLWMLSNDPLNHLSKFLRVYKDVPLRDSHSNSFHGRFKAQPIFSDAAVPIRISRHDRGIRMQRDTRNPGCRACGFAKKIY